MNKMIKQIYDAFVAKRFPDKDANDPYLDKWKRIFAEGYEWQQGDYQSRRALQEIAPIIYPTDLNAYFVRTDEVYKKVTVGYVVQDFKVLTNGTAVCQNQEFIAGDQVDYENEDGEKIEVDTDKEIYCLLDMVQPKHLPTNDKAKSFKLVNSNDGNDEISLESTDVESALAEALEVLGWSLVEKD